MQLCSRILTVQGLLCLMALAFAPGTAAEATQSALVQSPDISAQEPQHSQQMPSTQQPDTTQPDQSATKAVVVTGMIVKSGSAFVLPDSSGTVYQLDEQDKAQSYEGKSVKVTGKLEAETKILHVESIEELNA